MLQSFRESTGRWVAIAILGLIAITFVFFGVDFSLTGVTTFAAKVNGENIPLFEFERELQNQQNQYAQLYRMELDDELRSELRRNVVERLVRSTALQQRIDSFGYRISDERLSDEIRSTPAFQVGGEFSMDVYRVMLNNQGLSLTGFELLQRQQLELLELQSGVVDSTFFTPAEFRRYIQLYSERREVAYALFRIDDFLDQVEISDEAVAAHYDANSARYMSQETVDFEYVELEQAVIAAGIEVSDEELRSYYDDQLDRFQTDEERHARHILLTVEGDESQEDALAKAEDALARVRAGEDFSTVAAELSDDTGTSTQGGDLGWIARGMLEGPFEDALYGMQVGDIQGPVETNFGYHVLLLEEVRAGQVQSFEAVSEELREQYRSELADELFYDQTNELADSAFDAYDELATVATQMNLLVRTATGFSRLGDSQLFPNSAPVVQAAFSQEAFGGINSTLVELADNHVAVLRITQHSPSAIQSLDAVAEQINGELARSAAAELVAAAADAFLAAAEEGSEDQALAEENGGSWAPRAWAERADPEVPTELLATAFRLAKNAGDDPIRQPVPMANGDRAVLLLYAVESGEPDSIPREERDERLRQLAEQTALAELNGYVANIREQATVRIPDEVLNPQF